jgi:hypothetical protein
MFGPEVDADHFPSAPTGMSDFDCRVAEQITMARERYERDGDPFAPWQVYYAARALNREIPDWVTAHLDAAAEAIACRLRHRGSIDRAALAQALSFTTKRGPTRGAQAARDQALAEQVLARVHSGAQVKSAIIEVAQASDHSFSTVERAWARRRNKRPRVATVLKPQ